jgi:quercetin dioxygenase-like cupin family protein
MCREHAEPPRGTFGIDGNGRYRSVRTFGGGKRGVLLRSEDTYAQISDFTASPFRVWAFWWFGNATWGRAIEHTGFIFANPPPPMQKGNLSDKLAQFDEQWAPRIIGELNGQHVKVAKLEGPFEWHRHEEADELFLVLEGALTIERRNEDDICLAEGDFCIVPRGTEHRPVAKEEEAHVLLFEKAGTRNTGAHESERTVEAPNRI